MIAEDVEFQISQYADGTLPVAERSSVDDLLKADPQARKLLAEYRKLDGQLAKLRGVPQITPEIKWDKLAEHISNAIESNSIEPNLIESNSIEDETAPAVAGRIGWASWSGRLRIAAAVLITATVGVVVYHSFHRSTVVQPVNQPAAVSDVTGPSADVAVGPPSVDISISPSEFARSQAASRDVQNAIVPRKPSVIINEAIANPTKDKLHPH